MSGPIGMTLVVLLGFVVLIAAAAQLFIPSALGIYRALGLL